MDFRFIPCWPHAMHPRTPFCLFSVVSRPPPPPRLYSLGARCWDDVTRLSREGEISLPPRALVSLRHVEDLTAAAVPGEEVEEMMQVSGLSAVSAGQQGEEVGVQSGQKGRGCRYYEVVQGRCR